MTKGLLWMVKVKSEMPHKGWVMAQRNTVLVVHDQDESLTTLKAELEGKRLRVLEARSCEEALAYIHGAEAPQLVLTGTKLPDGTWADVLSEATSATEPLNVIVLERSMNPRLYMEVMQRGAFDFLVAPFTGPEFGHVLRCALDAAPRERAALRHAA